MISIVDYGVGNLFSLKSSFDAIGAEAVVTGDPEIIKSSEKIVLPGVGAFRDAIGKLNDSGLGSLLVSEAAGGKPVLGICLGMQLLLDRSFEFGEYKGLGLIPGDVVPLAGVIPAGLKIPQMGWNALKLREESPVFANTRDGEYVYFVHSYWCKSPREYVSAVCDYGAEITAAVRKDNVMGCQFHPEKSGPVGHKILRAFSEMQWNVRVFPGFLKGYKKW